MSCRLFLLLLLGLGCAPESSVRPAGAPSTPLEDRPMSTPDRAAERHGMVATQIVGRGITQPEVVTAMQRVPRHAFVPDDLQAEAYADGPLPIGSGQTISQPYIVALMTEALELQPGETVLEVGTGSGYQAAVLAEITTHVSTIEIVGELAERARTTLAELGYDSVEVRCGDGYAGWPERAPFDAIIVTAAPDHVPPALIEQLAPGGRRCLPVGEERAVQELIIIGRDADGNISRRSVAPVRFVPMTGEAQRVDGLR